MKFSISGTAPNGMPVSRLVDLPDEAAVHVYAQQQQIKLTRVRKLTVQQSQVHQIPLTDPEEIAEDNRQRRKRAHACFFGGWLCLLGGSVSLLSPYYAVGLCQFFPLSFFLFLLGATFYPWNAPLEKVTASNDVNQAE